jgi:hypothetical protein
MRKVPAFGLPKSDLTHNERKSRLPLNRLLEAKMLNSARGEPLRNALFPKRRAS